MVDGILVPMHNQRLQHVVLAAAIHGRKDGDASGMT